MPIFPGSAFLQGLSVWQELDFESSTCRIVDKDVDVQVAFYFDFFADGSTCRNSIQPGLTCPPTLATRDLQAARTTQTIALTVPKGTPLQIALDQEVRVKSVGQSIHGHTVEPIYAFDREVVPVGTEVTGRIKKIESLSGTKRMMGILNADFTPARKVDIEFNELVLAHGRQIPLHALVMPWSGQVMQLVSTKDEKKSSPTSEKIDQAKQEAREAVARCHEGSKSARKDASP